jgi:hypothetical protein
LAYELGILIHNSQLVWINGPFPAGQSDLQIFCKEGDLKSKIPAFKRIVGDEGYKGEALISSTCNPYDCSIVRRLMRRLKRDMKPLMHASRSSIFLSSNFGMELPSTKRSLRPFASLCSTKWRMDI